MNLDEIRRRIDALDNEIVDLLEERARLAIEAGKAKAQRAISAFDPDRERAVLGRVMARAQRLPASVVRAVYCEVMSACRALQEPVTVAYLGPAGAPCQAAALDVFGRSARYLEVFAVDEVFDALARGLAKQGVVPIEDAIEGLRRAATAGSRLAYEIRVLPLSHEGIEGRAAAAARFVVLAKSDAVRVADHKPPSSTRAGPPSRPAGATARADS